MSENNSYQNPLTGRYASREMSFNWSPQKKHSTWRRLWLALAKAEKSLGLDITSEQIAEMEAHLDDIDFELAAAKEKELHLQDDLRGQGKDRRWVRRGRGSVPPSHRIDGPSGQEAQAVVGAGGW